MAVRPGFLFLQSEDGLPRLHNALFIFKRGASMLVGEDIQIGFSDHLFGGIEAEPFGTGLID